MTIENTQEEHSDEHPDQLENMTENLPDQDLAPAENPRPTVGDELRMRREAAGQTIRDVADAVRIQRRYLEALESGQLENMPGTVYALGFLRTYAEYYGFNGDEFVTRFKEETEGTRRQQDYTLPEPIEETRVPTAAIVIVAVVLAVGAYVAWYSLRPQEAEIVGAVPAVPARLATLVEETPPAAAPVEAAPEPSVVAPAPVVMAPVEPERDQPVEAAARAEESSAAGTPEATNNVEIAVAPTARAEPVAPEVPEVDEAVHVPQTFGPGGADARIVIAAVEDSWIEISDNDGNLLLSRTMRTGDSYRVPNRDGLFFVTGNAGGLRITVDGTLAPPIGDTGIVRKNVRLDPDLLKLGRAWR